MKLARILVVDDDQDLLDLVLDSLTQVDGTDVIAESYSPRAVKRISSENFDLLITDLQMPEIDGMEMLREARRLDPDMPALMITGYPTVDNAVEAMKLGAVDYLQKPFNTDSLVAIVRRLLHERHLKDENRVLRRQIERPYSFDEVIGQSPSMNTVFETIRQLSETDVDVLITGETGTGKELVARSIHKSSRREKGPFIPVDSGAIPENLLESELFGHERGSFTGADTRRLGLMELANEGTFFLDEIGDMPMALQAKLLRALQERRIRRVGGKKEIPIDVRVVTATHRDLTEAIRMKRFREDLFYRLNVVRIELPPLRERIEDIPPLMSHFVDRFAKEMGRKRPSVSPDVVDALSGYLWPGNIRELQNSVKRALAMSQAEELTLADFPKETAGRNGLRPNSDLGFFQARDQRLASFEREYLTSLLRTNQGDVSQAARKANLPRGTLYRLMKKYELSAGRFRG